MNFNSVALRKKWTLRAACLGVGTVLLSGCGGPAIWVKNGEIARSMKEAEITDQYVQATGIGAADQSLTNKTQKMGTSREAAIAAAQFQLLSLIIPTS
jgi:hypothetical protein